MRRAVLLVLAACLAACPAALAPRARAAEGPEIDWDRVGHDTASLLSRYIQVDTSNPPGNEIFGARFLQGILARDGIDAEIFVSAPGRANLCARLPATAPDGRKAILLLSHIDVVPADPDSWSFPPFSGQVRGGHVYGRGAIDDKGHGAIQLMAFVLLARSGLPRARDIVLCATAAEETRGEGVGVDWMIENHWRALGPPEAVWNEGGGSVDLAALGRVVNAIAVAEKRGLWVTLVAEGDGGHGSQPIPGAAINRLVAALERVEHFEPQRRMPAPVAESLRRAAGSLDFPWSWLARLATVPFFLRLAGPWIDDVPRASGFVRDTIAITGLRAGGKHNVIPRRAEALLDIRMLPDTNAEAFLAALGRVIGDPAIRIERAQAKLAPILPASSWEHELFAAIEAEMERELEDSLTLPIMMPAGTDSKFFREKGVPAYGFMPLVLDPALTDAIHGLDERVPIAELERAVRVTYRTLLRLVREEEASSSPSPSG